MVQKMSIIIKIDSLEHLRQKIGQLSGTPDATAVKMICVLVRT
jgi:hypothetical protein